MIVIFVSSGSYFIKSLMLEGLQRCVEIVQINDMGQLGI